MPRKIRIGSWIFIILLSLFMIFMICGYKMLMRSVPVIKGRLALREIESSVRIYRDGYGIPYLFAGNEHDLFFTQGFVTAQNRLWQMDFLRHMVQGRLFEWFGKKAFYTDSLMRLSGIHAHSVNAAQKLSGDSRSILDRYSQGVNAYIRQSQNRLPLEFMLLNTMPISWKPEDSIALFELMVWQSDIHWLTQPFFAEIGQTINTPMIKAILSRFAVHTRTAPEEAVRLNGFLRSVIREGWLPPPVSGSMSWAVPPDRSVTGKPLFSIITRNALSIPASWFEIHLSSDEYRVSGLSLPGFPMVVLGHNGRIAWGWTDFISGIPDLTYHQTGQKISVEWSMLRSPVDITLELSRINRARNWKEFQSASGLLNFSDRYFVYADTSGDLHAGSLIADTDNRFPRDSSRLVPFQKNRAQALFSGKKQLSLEDVKQIQSDAVSDFALHFLKTIRPLMFEDSLTDPFENRLLQSLYHWDGSMKPGSAEAACFESLALRFLENLYKDEMGDSLFITFKNLPWLHPQLLLRTIQNPLSSRTGEIMKKSFHEAVSQLSQKWGTDLTLWSWAGLHSLSFDHPLGENPLYGKMFNLGPFAVGGCTTALLSLDVDASRPFRVGSGPSARMVVDLSNLDNTISVVPPGQSGQPIVDTHYQDQIQFYLQHFYHPDLWDSTKIAGSGWDLLVLEPEASRAGR